MATLLADSATACNVHSVISQLVQPFGRGSLFSTQLILEDRLPLVIRTSRRSGRVRRDNFQTDSRRL